MKRDFIEFSLQSFCRSPTKHTKNSYKKKNALFSCNFPQTENFYIFFVWFSFTVIKLFEWEDININIEWL